MFKGKKQLFQAMFQGIIKNNETTVVLENEGKTDIIGLCINHHFLEIVIKNRKYKCLDLFYSRALNLLFAINIFPIQVQYGDSISFELSKFNFTSGR